jgi:hypothetical protein
MATYLVLDEFDSRLCKDGCFRHFAYFGTYPECVKIYRVRGWAIRRAQKHLKKIVIRLPDGAIMDASGRIRWKGRNRYPHQRQVWPEPNNIVNSTQPTGIYTSGDPPCDAAAKK